MRFSKPPEELTSKSYLTVCCGSAERKNDVLRSSCWPGWTLGSGSFPVKTILPFCFKPNSKRGDVQAIDDLLRMMLVLNYSIRNKSSMAWTSPLLEFGLKQNGKIVLTGNDLLPNVQPGQQLE